jgi:hypothetical protein
MPSRIGANRSTFRVLEDELTAVAKGHRDRVGLDDVEAVPERNDDQGVEPGAFPETSADATTAL